MGIAFSRSASVVGLGGTQMLEMLLGLLLIAWEWAVSNWRFLLGLAVAFWGLTLLSGIVEAVNSVRAETSATRREIERLTERMEIRVGDGLDRMEGGIESKLLDIQSTVDGIEGKLDEADTRERLRNLRSN